MKLCHNLDDLLATSEKILLLQGPLGYFFPQLGQYLQRHNKQIFRLNFNQGDEYFYPNRENPLNPYAYRNPIEDFPAFLADLLQSQHIDSVICFGDHRPYHKIAKQLCLQHKLNFWVFEEGYFRPHYVTLERDGVNDYSTLPRNAEFFLQQAQGLSEPPAPLPLASGFFPMAKLATRYYTQRQWNNSRYPHYQHHRILNIEYYIKLWLISGLKRAYHYLPEQYFARQVSQGKLGDFYIVPLQVYDDSQVKVHSDFASVSAFLSHVLDSFISHAPASLKLVVKHHPMDRGFLSYKQLIKDYIKRYPQLKGRLFYVYDVPLPVFLRQAKAMITLNSTSGLSALLHNMPVLTLGRANYDFQGLTCQKGLAQFWHEPTPPNSAVFNAYRLYHLHKTQLNGSFYNQVVLQSNLDK